MSGPISETILCHGDDACPCELHQALRERDEARCIARWFDGWFDQSHRPGVRQHVEAYLDRDALDWLNWPDEKSYLRPTPVYEEGARVWDRGRVCECRDGQLVPVEDAPCASS